MQRMGECADEQQALHVNCRMKGFGELGFVASQDAAIIKVQEKNRRNIFEAPKFCALAYAAGSWHNFRSDILKINFSL